MSGRKRRKKLPGDLVAPQPDAVQQALISAAANALEVHADDRGMFAMTTGRPDEPTALIVFVIVTPKEFLDRACSVLGAARAGLCGFLPRMGPDPNKKTH